MTTQTVLEPSPYLSNPTQPSYLLSTHSTMATDFAMPVQHFTASPSQYTLYGTQSQQTSPDNSAIATPNNHSPTSPRTSLPPHLPAIGRQLRQPKSPLYVPAVLRPTDFSRRVPKPSPPTPPQSNHNSFEDVENARTWNRRSTGDSGKFGLGQITETEWCIKGLGEVTGFPTRNHWKPDHESQICDETTCTQYFSMYWNRRHHCRRCGNIFCDAHSSHKVPLDQDANFNPKGTASRSCEHCWHEYNSWAMARTSRSNSESSTDNPHTPSTPTMNCAPKGVRGAMGNIFGQKNQGGQPESVAASVPRDWHWSTF